MPIMFMNNVFMILEALHTTLDNMETETLYEGFITKNKVVDPSMLAFMEQLKSIATIKYLTEDMACYY